MRVAEHIEILQDLLISVRNENIGKSPEQKHLRERNREASLLFAITVLDDMECNRFKSPLIQFILAKEEAHK